MCVQEEWEALCTTPVSWTHGVKICNATSRRWTKNRLCERVEKRNELRAMIGWRAGKFGSCGKVVYRGFEEYGGLCDSCRQLFEKAHSEARANLESQAPPNPQPQPQLKVEPVQVRPSAAAATVEEEFDERVEAAKKVKNWVAVGDPLPIDRVEHSDIITYRYN